MKASFRNLSICYAAGLVGGLVTAIFVWACGASGLSAMLGVAFAPEWSPAFLYQKMVWGGIWGFIFLLPVLTNSVLLRGVLFGLGPSLSVLLFIFPKVAGKGMLGLDLGMLTPLIVLVANTVWGCVSAWWVILNQDTGRSRGRL